jgi:hypothetical protein
VRTDRMSNLYRINFVFCESVASRETRGKMLQRTPMALLVTVRKCLVFKSLKKAYILYA